MVLTLVTHLRANSLLVKLKDMSKTSFIGPYTIHDDICIGVGN